jgi:predicted enzyme related to lactoylglutathione lyase
MEEVMARISYVELPVKRLASVRDFYAQAFGWNFTDFGPDYSATTTGDVDLGMDAGDDAVTSVLPVVEVEDLEAALESVTGAGGTITVPIFAFPGGRRFHFCDPDGNMLGVFVNEPD